MKKLFQKVKLESKFQRAGEGHRLTDEPSHSGAATNQSKPIPVRERPMTESQANAAVAAIERHEKSKAVPSKPRIKHKVQTPPATVDVTPEPIHRKNMPCAPDESADNAVGAVKFISALNGDVLQKNDLPDHYRENLLLKLGSEEALSASCLMIHTLNRDSNVVEVAVRTLCKYLDNILSHENDEKFKRIRKGNKAFQERVACLEGTEEFLTAAGFRLTSLKTNDEEEGLFFILPNDANLEKLNEAKNCLLSTKPLESKLYRDRKIFRPSDRILQFEIPASFYSLTLDEIRREQDSRSEELELSRQLRTKEMREKPKTNKKYNYSIIRVRFPDGYFLQGTFAINEKFSQIRELISDSINVDWAPYILRMATGEILENDDATLKSLSLVPSVVLNLTWVEEVKLQLAEQGTTLSLRADLLENVEVLC